MKFAYNNNFQASIQMVTYENLYGMKCRSPLFWDEVDDSNVGRLEMIQEIKEQVRIIRDKLSAVHSQYKNYTDNHKKDLSFNERDWVFFKV